MGITSASLKLFNSYSATKKVKIQAIIRSIEKWHDIAFNNGEDVGFDNCALCAIYLPKDCAGCPVRIQTRKPFCKKSPYVSWANFWEKQIPLFPEHYISAFKISLLPREIRHKAQTLARAELWFLVKLLPIGIEAKMRDGTIYYCKE